MERHVTAEHVRLEEDRRRERNWKRWGPYLAERQWGTVREDYSADGDAWRYFPHEHARSRAYRWGEDGLMGLCDREGRLCFAVALWNGRDPFLKERLFGLTNPEGNHGEDVKECYFYEDATPTSSYLRASYFYPQAAFPYERLATENARRSQDEPEFELEDTGLFEDGRFWDVSTEYAKEGPDDVLIRITARNRGRSAATLHLLPTVWFRNTWVWGCRHDGCTVKPWLKGDGAGGVTAWHPTLGEMRWEWDGTPREVLFTENETNVARVFGGRNAGPVKDAFHDVVVSGDRSGLAAGSRGTKVAPWFVAEVPGGGEAVWRLRLRGPGNAGAAFGAGFDAGFARRRAEADEFYRVVLKAENCAEERCVARQAYAGLVWNRQFYHYVVEEWIRGDADQPPPPPERGGGRNRDWRHLFCRDILSMPDKWEYPWFAAWDTAFHMIPMARIDPDFAKQQLLLFLREWYLHPSGKLPAYEYNFSDVNPPVHAWAAWRLYKITGARGARDVDFLERVFQKLLLNFTWWVNRKDADGNHLFAGGFLGLDNIGVFDRSRPLPNGAVLHQADATAWMAFYCLTMMNMAIGLARHRPAYEDMASKFFEHFVQIADAMNSLGGTGLWDRADNFYYDRVRTPSGVVPLRTRSLVGLLPLIAVEVIEEDRLRALPGFYKRMTWFLENRPDLATTIGYCVPSPERNQRIFSVPSEGRLRHVLARLFDEREFLSPFGIRSLSRHHEAHPFEFACDGDRARVGYEPGEGRSRMFGGNSNWRGPVWMPVNYLIVEALERYHHFYGPDWTVEFPTGSGHRITLQAAAEQVARRAAGLFVKGPDGRRPYEGRRGPAAGDRVLFHEYFHADTGRGLGASHQTGWTALVTRFLEML